MDDLLYLTDVNYDQFEGELQRSKALFDSGSDIVLLGLGAAGSVHPAGAITQLLAATSAGVAGVRTSINKNFFHEKSVQALTAQMRAARARRLELVRKGMTLDVKQYSLARGLADLVAYYNAGTLLGAFAEITAQAGEKEKLAAAATDQIVEKSYATDTATQGVRDRIMKWLLADSTRPARLQEWLGRRTPPVTLTPAFWVSSADTPVVELLEAIVQFRIE